MEIPSFNPGDFGLTWTQVREYLESLNKHIYHVREAGMRIGVPLEQIIAHDASKFSMREFPYYARHFFGDKGDEVGFSKAWLHHMHRNEHHWQHWIHLDSYKGEGTVGGCMCMPQNYSLEMVADWMGASMAYQNTWDMTKWLTASMPGIRLHPDTASYVRGILGNLGYTAVVNTIPFYGEG